MFYCNTNTQYFLLNKVNHTNNPPPSPLLPLFLFFCQGYQWWGYHIAESILASNVNNYVFRKEV